MLFIIPLPFLFSQNFGGVPPGKKWHFKENENVRIIYDHRLKSIPDTILYYMDQIDQPGPFSLGDRREHVHLILRNENLAANGFVGYFPFRSEFYLHAAQDPNLIGFGDWIHLLSIHEYRHVIQYSNLRQGFLRPVRDVLGDAAQAGIYSILVPDWFSEGDAVFFETAYSNTGRGRLPSFTADLRALLLSDQSYSYDKFRNGSFRDLVPNHYVHGYVLAGYGYEKFSDDFWKNILLETSRIQGITTPFARAVRRNSDLKLKDFHQEAMDQYQNLLKEGAPAKEVKGEAVFPESGDITMEHQILTHPSGRRFLLEQSYDEIYILYEIANGKKVKRFALGRTPDPYLRLRDSRILFIGQQTHPRWTNRDYGDIYYYDVDQNKTIRVTRRQRFLSADYQEAEGLYLTVEADNLGESRIVSFEPQSGEKKILLEDDGTYYAYARWMEQGRKFFFTGRKNGKMYLAIHDPKLKNIDTLLSPRSESVSRPYQRDGFIYYSSGHAGTDNIYRVNIRTKETEQLTDVATGAYNPTATTDTLYYSLKNSKGQRIFKIAADSVAMKQSSPLVELPEPIFLYQDLFQKHPPPQPSMDSLPRYPAEKYNPGKNLFHFHSLFLELSGTDPRLSLLSNDYLNTTYTELYGQYFDTEGSYELGSRFTYAQWYPELSFTAAHQRNRRLGFMIGDEVVTIPKAETKFSFSAALPWNFSARQINHQLRLSGRYGITREHFNTAHPSLPQEIAPEPRLFQTGQMRGHWVLHRFMAYRDIFPRWGSTTEIDFNAIFTPARSQLLYASQSVFLPGFSKNDGFKFKGQGQWNSEFAANFLVHKLRTSNDLSYDLHSFRRGGIFTLNYMTPLFYPEISIPHILYTKRIALNFSTEHFTSDAGSATWSGIDLFLTAKYFNLGDLTAGVRIFRQWPLNRGTAGVRLLFLQDL